MTCGFIASNHLPSRLQQQLDRTFYFLSRTSYCCAIDLVCHRRRLRPDITKDQLHIDALIDHYWRNGLVIESKVVKTDHRNRINRACIENGRTRTATQGAAKMPKIHFA